ncbi:MerR family transcriptional regulator [Nocardiopsis changdeensis]|nr:MULTISPECIES: MerR family transcriptional regulator [Nocardiopsis]
MNGSMRIGVLAEHAGVSTRALRYYEEQGLLTPERTPSGQRVYPPSAVERVQIIRQFFAAGLNSRTVAAILPSVDAGRAAPGVLESLRAERARITAGIAELQEAGRRLDRVIELTERPDPEHCPALREQAAAS